MKVLYPIKTCTMNRALMISTSNSLILILIISAKNDDTYDKMQKTFCTYKAFIQRHVGEREFLLDTVFN